MFNLIMKKFSINVCHFKFIYYSILFFQLNQFKCNINTHTASSSQQIYSNPKFVNHVFYSEIKKSLNIFPDDDSTNSLFKNIQDFGEILIDKDVVYIGARNHLIKLSYKNQSATDVIEWSPNTETKTACTNPENCDNYLRLILLESENPDSLLVCGTNANRPVCTRRNKQDPAQIYSTFNGIGKIPSDPKSSLSYLNTHAGDIYIGTSIDYSDQGMIIDYLIHRASSSSESGSNVRTSQFNSNWLNKPAFVGSLTINDYVYFFIRETAIEYMNCGEKVYSRVIRLCKHDQGINNLGIWKSFEKARLNCSVASDSDDFPFYFEEIQDIHFDEENQLIYAIFATPSNAIKGSAVCVYDVAALDAAFNGPFKHQKRKDSIWEPYTEPLESYKCGSHHDNISTNSNKFQLKDLSVQPLYGRPILALANTRLLKITVDNVLTKSENLIRVLFLATEHNTIHKYMLLNFLDNSIKSTQPALCLLEEIEIFDSNSKSNLINSINNLVLFKPSRDLLIATKFNVIKMPLAQCDMHTNYFSCLSLMDPYCIWDSNLQQCVLIFNTKTLSSNNFHQHRIDTCPLMNLPVDGGFSEWSSETSCLISSNSTKTIGEKCKCRVRQCDSPKPRNGGKNCDETQSIEILGCQVNGGWTDWSTWSGCKGGAASDCDLQLNAINKLGSSGSTRTRFRTCTNPEPKFNGRVCIGLDQEEESCTMEMINPCLSRSLNQNQWMAWGAWEQCSKTCDEGFQMRRRLCNGKHCLGCNQEWKTCNEMKCKEREEELFSDWDLIEANEQSEQKLEKRFKFKSKYDHFMETSNLNGMELNFTIEYRICYEAKAEEKSCHRLNDLKDLGVFSEWSDWSECEKCGDEQYRTRQCNSVKLCFGHDRETRECSCKNKLTNGWSCWSDYTPCSVACGKGTQKRSRECTTKNMLDCVGNQIEEITTCYSTNCSTNEQLSELFLGQTQSIMFTFTHVLVISVLAFLLGTLTTLLIIYIKFKNNSKLTSPKRSLFECCSCQRKSESDKQLSSSLDHNSLSADTAMDSDALNMPTNEHKYCSNSSDSSELSNHSSSKEYFTIGNRFDPTAISSLLNDVIPDDDDEMMNIGINSGTLSRNQKNYSKNNFKQNGALPNKSFNTYTNSKIGGGGIEHTNLSTLNNGNSRYPNYGNVGHGGSIRSTAKNNQRTSFAAFSMRTNLDQDL